MMELHYLGTAAAEGWPALFCRCDACKRAWELKGKNIRTRHSALMDGIIKFDFNADTYHQMLRDRFDLAAVEVVLMTHSHEDHLAPGDLIFRQSGFAHGVDKTLHIYGNDRVLTKIRHAFPDFGRADIQLHLIRPFVPFEAAGAIVVPLFADHDPLETCVNYLVTRGNKTLLYMHDSGWWPEDTWRFMADWAARGNRLDLASFDCTFCADDVQRGHMGIPAIARVRDELVRLGAATAQTTCIISHFSHNRYLMHHELEAVAHPQGLQVAYDGMKVTV